VNNDGGDHGRDPSLVVVVPSLGTQRKTDEQRILHQFHRFVVTACMLLKVINALVICII
jgi:hypothetical protein